MPKPLSGVCKAMSGLLKFLFNKSRFSDFPPNPEEWRCECLFPPVPDADLDQITALLVAAGFADESDRAVLQAMISGSVAAVVARNAAGEIIGFVRAVGDGVSDAYIQDAVVHPGWRRRGIGAAMIREIIRTLRSGGTGWIALVGVPGSEKFYAGLGFDSPSGHTFWKLPDK